jgi:hypothetical protein
MNIKNIQFWIELALWVAIFVVIMIMRSQS